MPGIQLDFEISLGSVSKAIASLEDQLWVRRRGAEIVVPERSQLLQQWAEKYKERYRWRLRRSFQTNNPFGLDLQSISQGLEQLRSTKCAFSWSNRCLNRSALRRHRCDRHFSRVNGGGCEASSLKSQPDFGPALRFSYPYDDGVFMYSKGLGKALVVSGVQAYLDLYARGGRHLKQAEFLLSNTIRPELHDSRASANLAYGKRAIVTSNNSRSFSLSSMRPRRGG